MNREERERRVDGALARALKPESVDPREGFEERLLANLAAQPERGPWWRWMWVPALAAATVLIAIVMGLQTSRRRAPVIETNRTTARPEQPAVAEKAPVKPPHIVQRRVTRRTRPHVQIARATPPLPKQDVFPTPVPMTGQERLLVALVHRRPQQVQKIAAEQEADRQQIQKYLESGFPTGEPAQQMR